MKKFIRLAAAILSFAPAVFAAPNRTVGKISFPAAPYPPAADKKGVVGNVVLTADIGADGKLGGILVLASSSPLLDDAAVEHLRRSKFAPGMEDGKPVPLVLNAVVRFRKDRTKLRETGTMPAPILGNLAVTPTDEKGKTSAPEGFSVGPSDRGIRGEVDVDLPKGSGSRTFHVVVTDRFPGERTATLLDRKIAPEGPGPSLSATVFRMVDRARRDEVGVHTLLVTIDGKNAGGARYRVAGDATAPPPRPKTRPKK